MWKIWTKEQASRHYVPSFKVVGSDPSRWGVVGGLQNVVGSHRMETDVVACAQPARSGLDADALHLHLAAAGHWPSSIWMASKPRRALLHTSRDVPPLRGVLVRSLSQNSEVLQRDHKDLPAAVHFAPRELVATQQVVVQTSRREWFMQHDFVVQNVDEESMEILSRL